MLLGLEYGSMMAEMAFATDGTSRALEWPSGGTGGLAGTPIDGSKIQAMLEGKTAATLEVVADVDGVAGGGSAVAWIGEPGGSGLLALRATTTGRMGLFLANVTVGDWFLGFGAEERVGLDDAVAMGLERELRGVRRPLERADRAVGDPARRVEERDAGLGVGGVQQIELIGPRQIHHAARREQRMVGEALRRLAVEATRGHGDGPDFRAPVGFRMQRRGAAGRVIGRDMLALENDHFRMGREMKGGGNPGDAGADDGEIEILHAAHIARLLPCLQ